MQPSAPYNGQQTLPDNIILIGMPGVGKSTAGVVLAKVLNYDFLDSDLVIQRQTGKRLSELIDDEGIDGFNALEERVNCEIRTHRTVIATGGSVVYGARAMAHFGRTGIIVYLKAAYPALCRRLGDLDRRGVVHRPGQTLADLYDERCALYEKYADITVSTDDRDIEATVSAVVDTIAAEFPMHCP